MKINYVHVIIPSGGGITLAYNPDTIKLSDNNRDLLIPVGYAVCSPDELKYDKNRGKFLAGNRLYGKSGKVGIDISEDNYSEMTVDQQYLIVPVAMNNDPDLLPTLLVCEFLHLIVNKIRWMHLIPTYNKSYYNTLNRINPRLVSSNPHEVHPYIHQYIVEE